MKRIYKLLFLFLVVFSTTSWAQNSISGTVFLGTSDEPAIGATVRVSGTSEGAITDLDGQFILNASNGDVITVSYVGYQTQDQTYTGGELIFRLSSGTALDEIVVTALGIEKETRALGYSLTEVDGEEVSRVKQTNAINALQGKVAGVNITQNSTGAAGSSRVIIRGATSISGNSQPLYVVDGIPISNVNNGESGTYGGSDGGDGISSINPDDIATMSVLKGGAASALYGSRASNGVILITTKSGKGTPGLGVDFSSSTIIDNVDTRIYDLQNQYGQGTMARKPANAAEALDLGLFSWGAKLDGTSVVQWDGVERPYSAVEDNLKRFYDTGTTFVNTLAISNSGENYNYRFAATNLDNSDLVPNAGLERNNFSLNAGVKLGNKITSNFSAKYLVEDVNNRPRLSDAPGNANYTVVNLSPNVNVESMQPGANPDGTERGYSNNVFSQNPYFSANNFRNEDTKNRIIASANLRYDITDWLYISGRTGVDYYGINRVAVEPFGTAYKPLGGIEDKQITYSQIDADAILGVNKDLSNKFGLSTFIGVNKNTVRQEDLVLNGQQFIVPGLEDFGNTNNRSSRRDFGERKLGSVYGSAEFNYDNLAFITFTGRNDWFSTLSFPGKTTPNDEFYPSVNASFVLSDAFAMGSNIDFLKLRGGYSEVAGGADNPYALSLTYQIFGQGHLGQPLGAINGNQIPNSNLVPRLQKEYEIGVDARFFNRLSLDLGYYNTKVTRDIVGVGTSVFSGYNTAIANIGEMENKGFEFLISGTPVKTDKFDWDVTINGTYNKSEIIATDADNGNISIGEPRTLNVQIQQIVGQPYGVIFGVAQARDANGTPIYDINSDGVPIARNANRKILGEGVPPYQFGMTNNLQFKNFNLNFLIDSKFGGQIFSGTNTVLYGNGLHKDTLEGRENGLEVNGIDQDGNAFTTTVAPEDLQTYWGEYDNIAEHFVEDADYIKLREMSLGYRLPSNFLDETFIQSANIGLTARNLFFIHKSTENIDPESAYSSSNAQGLEYFGLPPTRNIGLNLNIKF